MRLLVSLTRDEAERLLALATAERRRPQEQASVLLAKALARRGGPGATGGQRGRARPAPPFPQNQQ